MLENNLTDLCLHTRVCHYDISIDNFCGRYGHYNYQIIFNLWRLHCHYSSCTEFPQLNIRMKHIHIHTHVHVERKNYDIPKEGDRLVWKGKQRITSRSII